MIYLIVGYEGKLEDLVPYKNGQIVSIALFDTDEAVRDYFDFGESEPTVWIKKMYGHEPYEMTYDEDIDVTYIKTTATIHTAYE